MSEVFINRHNRRYRALTREYLALRRRIMSMPWPSEERRALTLRCGAIRVELINNGLGV